MFFILALFFLLPTAIIFGILYYLKIKEINKIEFTNIEIKPSFYKIFLYQNKSWIFILLSIIAAFCLITNPFIAIENWSINFVSIGFFIWMIVLVSIIIWHFIELKKTSKLCSNKVDNSENVQNTNPKNNLFQEPIWKSNTFLWAIISLFFATIFFVKDGNPLLSFFNFFAVIYSVSFLIQSSNSNWKCQFNNVLFLPISLFFEIINTTNFFKTKHNNNPEIQNKSFNTSFGNSYFATWKILFVSKQKHFKEILIGGIFTIILMLIVVPLLASTNPIFNNLSINFTGLFSTFFGEFWFNFAEFLKSFIFGLNFWRVVFGFLFYLILPRLFSLITLNFQHEKEEENTQKQIVEIEKKSHLNFAFLTPKFGIFFTLLVYIFSQISFYFARDEYLTQLGYNFGKLNNEIFGQLSLVCLIIFGLLFLDKSYHKIHKIVSFLLIFAGGFLNLVATKSVADYMLAYGLTFKRLYGMVVVIFIFTTLLFFLVQNIKNLSEHWFIKRLIYVLTVLLILVNLANFDRLIYLNLPIETKGKDYSYLAELSLDSDYFPEILDKIISLRRNSLNNIKVVGDVPVQPDTIINLNSSSSEPSNSNPSISLEQETFATFETMESCQKIAQNCRRNSEYSDEIFYYETQKMLDKTDYLQVKYNNFNWNNWASFNLIEWQTWQKIQKINTTNLRKELLNM